MTYKHLLLLFFLVAAGHGMVPAQEIRDFRYLKEPIQRETFLSVGLNRIHMANPAATRPENHRESIFNLYLDLRYDRIERGEASVFYTNPLLTDLIWFVKRTLDDPNMIYRAEGSSLSSGPIGWLNLGWNLSGPGAIQPMLGFHHHDYFLSSSYVVDTVNSNGNLVSPEPQGYYFSAGPMLGARAAAGKWALVELRSMYGLSYLRAASVSYAERNDAYPKPHWLHFQADLRTKWGLFFSLQHHRLINRGDRPNTTRRTDAVLGFQIML